MAKTIGLFVLALVVAAIIYAIMAFFLAVALTVVFGVTVSVTKAWAIMLAVAILGIVARGGTTKREAE